MKAVSNKQLANRIHAFLDKKLAMFPELRNADAKPSAVATTEPADRGSTNRLTARPLQTRQAAGL